MTRSRIMAKKIPYKDQKFLDQVARFCKENHLAMMVLFGSQVTGELTFKSDIDVAILLKETIKRFQRPIDFGQIPPDIRRIQEEKIELMGLLNDFFMSDQVDMTILTPETDPLLAYEIFRKGIPLYEEHPGIFDEWYLRSWKLYIDSAKFRRLQLERLKKSIDQM